jgi:hypothetical protein
MPRTAVDPMTDDERRLLELLAASADGTTDALLVAHGFDFDLIARLVREGLATATPDRTFAAGKPVEVTRVRITDAGRRALEERPEQRRDRLDGCEG